MRKNSQLHVVIETHKLNRLKEEANKQGVSLSELCRQELKLRPQIDRIEGKIDGLMGK